MLKLRRAVVATAMAVAAPAALPSALAQPAAGTLQLAMMDMMPMGSGSVPQQGADPMPMPMPMQHDGRSGMGSNQEAMPQMPSMASPGGSAPPMGTGGTMNDNMMRMMQTMMCMRPGQQGMQQMPGMQGAMPQANPGGMAPMDDDMMGMSGQAGMTPMGSPAARLEGRIAFLRAELAITPAQAPAWDEFASTLRIGREHLDAARMALQTSGSATDPMARLDAYENHLRQRVDAIHKTRMAFSTLFAQLDDTQKRKATTTMLPFIGRF